MRSRLVLILPVLLAMGAARTPILQRCADLDGDGRAAGRRCASAVDCDDRDVWTYPGARQRPDGKNNDCGHPSWPFLAGTNEFDDDQDGFDEITGDCNDGDETTYPGAAEICNGYDDDCNGAIDDGVGCLTACVAATLPLGPLRVTNEPAVSGAPQVVWTGTEYALVWEDLRAGNFGNEVFFARLDRSGQKLGGDIRVTHTKGPSYEPQLVWTGSEFGVAWYVPFIQIFFDRLNPEGNVVGPSVPVTGSKDGYGTRLAWDGTNYAVTWLQLSAVQEAKVSFARFTGTGGYLGTTTLANGVAVGIENSPSIVYGGGAYAVTWIDQRAGTRMIGFARVDSEGSVLHQGFVPAGTAEPSLLRLFWSGADFGIFWQDSDAGASQVRYTRLDGAGNVLTPTRAVGLASADAIAWTGSEYGIVHTCGEGLCYSRRGIDGEPLGNAVGLPGAPGAPRGAQLVWNGRGFGLVWMATAESQNDEIYFAGIACAASEDPGDDDPGDDDPGDDDPGDDDPGDDAPQAGAFFSIAVDQFIDGLKRQQDCLRWDSPAGVHEFAAFLPVHAGLDAIDVQPDGDIQFSVEATAGVWHAGGYIVLDASKIYHYDRQSGEIHLAIDWNGTSPIGDVVALDRTADGNVAFSVAETRGVHYAGGYLVLLPGNVYFYDRVRQSIALGVDLRARGLVEVDAIDQLDAGRAIAFSVATDRAMQTSAGQVLLRQQSAYRLDLASGAVSTVVDGVALGLGSLDALDLGSGPN